MVASGDGLIFLTDPAYGYEQGFRTGRPQLGSNVYRYDPATKELTVVATHSLQRPNGAALLDERDVGGGCTLFLTDSGFEETAQKPRGFDGYGDSAVYMMKDPAGCFEPTNRQHFVGPIPLIPTVNGIQDGIKVHRGGGHRRKKKASEPLLLYCDGSGMWVWSIEKQSPIGIVRMPEGSGGPGTRGCTQLAIGRHREIRAGSSANQRDASDDTGGSGDGEGDSNHDYDTLWS